MKLESLYQERARANLSTGGNHHQPLENSTNPVDTRLEVSKVAHVSDNTIARIKTLERLCQDDKGALDLLDQAVRMPNHRPSEDISHDNIMTSEQGTTRSPQLG